MKTGDAWLILAFALAAPTAAQEGEHRGHHSAYADQEDSGIAALSQREARDLREGAGMGLARAAELNHYPGPLHVLELADELGLSATQRTDVERFRAEMSAAAKQLGVEILAKEERLDRRFLQQHIDESSLRELTAAIARLQGELRFVHLRAHLRTKAVLEPHQVEAYDRLRGYGKPASAAAEPEQPSAALTCPPIAGIGALLAKRTVLLLGEAPTRPRAATTAGITSAP